MFYKIRAAISFVIATVGICSSLHAYTIDDVMSGIQWRERQTSSAAVEFKVNCETGRSQELINGRMIVSRDRFLLDFKHDRGKERGPIVRARSFDGETTFRVIHDEGRVVRADETDYAYNNHIRQLILNPGVLATGKAMKDNRGAMVFDREEVLSVSANQESGGILVVTDGTKRSDYDKIIYTLLPGQGWAIRRVEYQSGGRIVATLEGQNFLLLAPTNVPIASEWVYQRHDDLTQLLPGKVRKATVQLSLLPEVDFENNKTFQLDFADYGVVKNPREEGKKAARQKIQAILGTNNAKYYLDDFLDESIESLLDHNPRSLQTQPDTTTQLQNNTHKVNNVQVQGSTEQLRSQDCSIVANGDNKKNPQKSVTHLARHTSRWSMVGTILGIVAILFILCSRALLRVRRSETSVQIQRSFLVVGIIALALIAISVIVLTAEPITPVAARSEEQILVKEERYSYSASPISYNWPCDLNKTTYVGRIDVGGDKMVPYQGQITRKNEIETHVWYTGAIKNMMVMDHETTKIFIGNLKQPVATYWSPSMYSLLTKLAHMKGIPINVFDKNWEKPISLDGLKFKGKNLRSAQVEINYLENNLLKIELQSKNKPIYIVNVTPKEEGGICEEHSYYDSNGAIIFRYEVEYSD